MKLRRTSFAATLTLFNAVLLLAMFSQTVAAQQPTNDLSVFSDQAARDGLGFENSPSILVESSSLIAGEITTTEPAWLETNRESLIGLPTKETPTNGFFEQPAIEEPIVVLERPDSYSEFQSSNGIRQQVELKSGCQTKTISVEPMDEVWLVSARDCRCADDLNCLDTRKLVCGQWESAQFSQLTNEHLQIQEMETVVYVHGNQTDYSWAKLRGMELYQNAFATTTANRKPIRYVIWCWRSDRELTRVLPDYKIKSERAVLAGRTFGKALSRFRDRNMMLVGFSLGSQVILSALEEPGLQRCNSPERKFRVALIAAAVNSKFVCQRLGANPPSCPVERSIIFTNKDDRAVKASRLVVRRDCPAANCTFAQLAAQGRLPLGQIRMVEISTEIGRKHSVSRYAKSNSLQRSLAEMINSGIRLVN